MRRSRSFAALFALLAGLLPAVTGSADPPTAMAGVGIADATWHVGTGSGQYAAKDPNAVHLASGGADGVDPFNHGLTQQHSYGVQSRLTYRALVVQGTNGKRVALVKSDSYLAQDVLIRRAAQILEAKNSSIGYDQIMLMASHNHSSPYYMSPSWGVWLFQDAFELRTFEYHARQLAQSILNAENAMRPARMGATTVRHTIYKGMIAGATITDDGSPGGYPETVHTCTTPDPMECVGKSGNADQDAADYGVTVMRFDDISGETPKPLGVWVNHGQHPESLDGYALITADYLGPLERQVERTTGAPLIFSQGDVGSAEGPGRGNQERLPDGVYRAWAHVGHAQTERGAKYLANSIIKAYNDIGSGNVGVPFSSDFDVDYATGFIPLPLSHPYPSVSNCRSETTVEGSPGSPIIGLPDCERATGADPNNMVWENLKAHGLPVPDHYDAPSHAAVEENYRLRLQAFRVREVVISSCACEAQNDIIRNFETRADNVAGNIWDGYDWGTYCTQNEDTSWKCPRPGVANVQNPSATITIPDARYKRMKAQVHNDAKGWELPSNVVTATSEPADPGQILGNFTKTELGEDTGYAIAVGVGHAGDYNGYTVSYREYMSRDHYRKALTCCGPHTADYMATNMMRLAASMHGGPAYTMVADPNAVENGSMFEDARLKAVAAADEARQEAQARALGAVSSAAYDAWITSLPADLGPVAPVTQPSGITRFQAATFSWRGGSNATDNPRARVERQNPDGSWTTFADDSGEVQTMVKFPANAQQVDDVYAGTFPWFWTANFEAFDAFPAAVIPGGQIPDGTYRFVVEGQSKTALATDPVAYTLASDAFHVGPWTGITASNRTVDNGGNVSFTISNTYPRTYTSPFRFVRDDNDQRLCRTCSFRPWASRGDIVEATVTVVRADTTVDLVPATWNGTAWTAATALQPGDVASIAPGGIVDSFGEINGTAFAF